MAEVVLIVFPVFILVVISLLLSKKWDMSEKVAKEHGYHYVFIKFGIWVCTEYSAGHVFCSIKKFNYPWGYKVNDGCR